MTLLAHAQRLADAGEKASVAPWVVDESPAHPDFGEETALRDGEGSPIVGTSWYDGMNLLLSEADRDFIALARTSPDVARAYLRAIAVLRQVDECCKGGDPIGVAEYDAVAAVLADAEKPDAGQGRV